MSADPQRVAGLPRFARERTRLASPADVSDQQKEIEMRRLVLLTIAVTALLGAATASSASKQATLCVGREPGCYSSLLAAVNAAGDGTTIEVRSGTWAGGVTVTKSLILKGVGNAVVRGGGPVLTIGSATSTPTVRISNLTFTGGVTHGNPQAPSCGPDVPTCGPGYATAT